MTAFLARVDDGLVEVPGDREGKRLGRYQEGAHSRGVLGIVRHRDWTAEEVGEHLRPDGAGRAAAGEADAGGAVRVERREVGADGEAHAFEDRVVEILPAVRRAEADKGATHVRIEERETLAGEVGQEDQVRRVAIGLGE